MENKKNVKQNFLHRLSNFNFRKKKKKERWKKMERRRNTQFVINYHTPFHEFKNSKYLLPLFW